MYRLTTLIAAVLFAMTTTAAAQQAGNGSWEFKAPISVDGVDYPIQYIATGAAAGQILFVTSFSLPDWTTELRLLKYSPFTDAWTLGATLAPPAGGYLYPGSGAAGCGDSFYLLGSFIEDADGNMTWQATFRYTVATNAWTRVNDLPPDLTIRSTFGTATRIHFTARSGPYPITQRLHTFDPSGDNGMGTFAEGPDLPTSMMSDEIVAASGGKVYLFNSDSSVAWAPRQTFVFDPDEPATGWIARAAPPVNLPFAPRAEALGRIYLLSDYVSYTWPDYTHSIYEYNVQADQWTARTGMPDFTTSSRVYYHGGAALMVDGAPRIYCTGGTGANSWYASNMHREFTPPDYGQPPYVPSTLSMRRTDGAAIPADGWTNESSIVLCAVVTDPNIDQVKLEVEVVREDEAFTGAVSVAGTLAPEGPVTATFAGLSPGAWKWQCRARDWNDNVSPWIAGSGFNVDMVPPSGTTGLSPAWDRQRIWARAGGPVTFTWNPATADAQAPLNYEVQVSQDRTFTDVPYFALVVGATSCQIVLPPSLGNDFHWRVRTIDAAGNAAVAWSPALGFEVYWDDGVAHAVGDAKRVCGFGATGGSGWIALLLFSAMIRGRGGVRRDP